jgi:hypothetical protein
MTTSGFAGTGRAAALNLGDVHASRAEMEEWLAEIGAAAEAKQELRHAQIMSVAYWILAVAVVAAVASVVAAVFAFLALK